MRHAILVLLALGPKHGLLLKQEFEAVFGAVWPPVNVGQIYTTLQRLERDGLIAGQEVEQEGRPNKTTYRITGAGLEELRGWFAQPSDAPRLRDDFLMKVTLAAVTGVEDPAELVQRQRGHYLQLLRDIDTAAAGVNGANGGVDRLLIEGASLHLQADLKWLDLCEQWLEQRDGRAGQEKIR